VPPDRYQRQRLFAPIGDEGQRRLGTARAALIGCGALGCTAAQHLARAGVGSLTIYDRDFLTPDNLQRQTLFDEADLDADLPKAEAAARRLRRINGQISVEGRVLDVGPANVESIVAAADVLIDGTDNFETRLLINDACYAAGKPWIYAGVVGAAGMLMNLLPPRGPCFRCLVQERPAPGTTATCDTDGILNAAAGAVASLQAGEALKILAGRREALLEGLLTVDLWTNTYRTFRLPPAPDCPTCAHHRYDALKAPPATLATVLCGRQAVQVTPHPPARLDLARAAARLRGGAVRRNEFLLRYEDGDVRFTLFPDGRAIILGTSDPDRARSVYARFIGS
jgi:adenylyltransferase/sulfurtransferase